MNKSVVISVNDALHHGAFTEIEPELILLGPMQGLWTTLTSCLVRAGRCSP